jgi:GTP cyclohydrolase II
VRRPIVIAVGSASEARRFAARHELDFAGALHLAGAELPTRHGRFRAEAFATLAQPERHHLALVRGDLDGTPLVRVHRACPASERFGSLACDCAARLRTALRDVGAAEAGILIYLRGDDAELVLGSCVLASGEPEDGDTARAILRALGVERYQAEPAET